MAKQSIAKPTRSITSALLLVALLLPVILYLCVFWRSGVFSSVSDVSSFFASGTYTDSVPIEDSFEILYTDAAAVGLSLTWDPDTLTLTINGECTKDSYLSIFSFHVSEPTMYLLDTEVTGSLSSGSFFYWQHAKNYGAMNGTYFMDSTSFSAVVDDSLFSNGVFYIALRAKVGTFTDVKLRFTEFEVSRFFGDHPTLTHSPGSFGEFLCNNFTVSEVNELVSRPVLYAVGSLNNGYVSAESQYNIYVICAYFTYVIFVYLVFLIVKLLTFIPCVIIKYVNKATGGDHFG